MAVALVRGVTVGNVTVLVRPGHVLRYAEDTMYVMYDTIKRAGFTLTELMAGVAVVGVMVTVAAPTMTDFLACQRLNSTARAVAADLQLSRMQAVSQHVNHQVAFASDPSTYTLSRWDTVAGAYVPLKAAQTFDHGVDLVSADGAIVFRTYGASPTGITVTLDSPQCGKQKTVSVNTIGRVKIL